MRGHEDCPFVPALAQLRTEASGGNDSRTLAFRPNLNERQILGLVEWGRKGRYKGAKLPLYFVTSRRQLLSVATTPGCCREMAGSGRQQAEGFGTFRSLRPTTFSARTGHSRGGTPVAGHENFWAACSLTASVNQIKKSEVEHVPLCGLARANRTRFVENKSRSL